MISGDKVKSARVSSLRFRQVLLFTILILLCVASDRSLSAQSSDISIGTNVQQYPVKRLGINLAGQTAYDSGQMMRNLIFLNPGFEGETWQSAIQCAAATSNTCRDANIYNVWPSGFLNGGTYEVISGAASGETGTITSSTTASYNQSLGLTLTIDPPSKPLQAGDWVIVRKQFPGDAQAGWWTSNSGGGSFLTDTTDLSPESPGKQALELKAAETGQSATVSSFFDSWPGRSFLQLNGTYTLTFRAKGVGGNNNLNISLRRMGTSRGNITYLNENVTLSNEWKNYTYTFNASEDGTSIGTIGLSFAVSGASIYLDDVSLTEPAASDNPTAFRNAVVNTLKTLQPGVIRYMTQTDWGTSINNIIAVPFARERAGSSSESSQQSTIPMGLEEFLVLCQTVGAEPWYTMPGEMTPTEMQNLIEFLAGEASTTYGAKRAALGQSAPWTSIFPVIHLELGNEMWNNIGSAGTAIINPAVYGQRAARVFGAARASASFNASKFDLVMGSQAVNSWWTQQEMANSANYDSVDAAPYLFNNLSDYSSNQAIWGPMFAEPEMIDSRSGGYMAQQVKVASRGKTPAKVAIYEVNLSTTSGSAPQNVLNQAAAGLGAGLAVADHNLLMMRDLGITTQNVFAISDYVNPFNNSGSGGEKTPLWATVIDMGGETNLKRPQYLAEQLVNTAILPTMLSTTITGADPTWNQPRSANDGVQLSGAHYLQSFAFTDGTRKSVVVFNLSLNSALKVTFSGANAPSGKVQISELTSKEPSDNNEGLTTDNPVVAPHYTQVTNFNPSAAYSLPPYSMTVFLWGGETAVSPTTTSLDASPASAEPGQTIRLTASVAAASSGQDPSGEVTFFNGSTSLGSALLDSAGVASLNTAKLPLGSDQITATYSGDTTQGGSKSRPVTVAITAPTATSLSASATQVSEGQNVTLTAKVSPKAGSVIPSGSVNFLNGSTRLGSVSLNQSGIATLVTSSLPVGTQSVTASYAGSSDDSGSVSSAVTVDVSASTGYAINYSNGFAQAKGAIQLNGSSAISGSALELTNGHIDQFASAFFETPVNIQSFTTNFSFHLVNPNADGITFAIQNEGLKAVGMAGGALGYQNIPKSIAIKFDLHNNSGEGLDSTGIYTGGASPTVPAISLSGTGINLHSGDEMEAQITYNGTILELTITDAVTKAKWSQSFKVDIPAEVGSDKAYVGFTGGTGGSTADQFILSWTYRAGQS